MDTQNNKATLVHPRVNGENKKKTEIFSTEQASLATPSSNQKRRVKLPS